MNQPLYFILADFGPKLGKAWVERDPKDMDRETTIANIARGEWCNVVQVIEVDLTTCNSRDVTAEILQAAAKRDETNVGLYVNPTMPGGRGFHVYDDRGNHGFGRTELEARAEYAAERESA